MTDREKVIKSLEAAVKNFERYSGDEYGREYDYARVGVDVLEGALTLLKAQEPRVMKVGEVRNWVNSDRVTREPVVIEIRGGVCAWIIDDEVRELPGEENLSSDLYGKTWRCWTSRPTDEQREATPWDMGGGGRCG